MHTAAASRSKARRGRALFLRFSFPRFRRRKALHAPRTPTGGVTLDPRESLTEGREAHGRRVRDERPVEGVGDRGDSRRIELVGADEVPGESLLFPGDPVDAVPELVAFSASSPCRARSSLFAPQNARTKPTIVKRRTCMRIFFAWRTSLPHEHVGADSAGCKRGKCRPGMDRPLPASA